ncbi:hypothetical protein TthWC1_1683 [Thermoanaerobacter thermohydrosulfuricus WC1]|uniref:Uncharacterized protein n=2 Tax=Thermoanaerobacter TaxID=1754 RepID=D3T371_THEIA|nr:MULTISPECIES: hypothetical protein [Thermoanaerobacter]ADD02673.1 conserved hypothetical protein [Thermoanaerobacter italicus Ab9]EMT38787.1 hypothetical protein TthWC1_1683 [Thermoanaerobacter thermohydrosulfuricus WC1]
MRTINRKIQFFYTELLVYDEETNSAYNNADVVEKVFNHINSLVYRENIFDSSSRYYQVQDGNVLFVTIDSEYSKKTHIYGKAIISRKTLLPELERNGKLQPLTKIIPPNSGLAETSHFIYFPEKNILGFEMNYYGPRPSQLAVYLQNKANDIIKSVILRPILNLDVEEKLEKLKEIALLSIEVRRNGVFVLQQLDENLYKAFEAAASFSEAETVEIVLRKKRYVKKGFIIDQIEQFKKRIINILSNQSNREQFLKFKGSAYFEDSGQYLKTFDFLEDKMIGTKKVLLIDEKSKKVDSNSAYSAIEEAYNELYDAFCIESLK